MKVVVVGGAGYIGSHMVQRLLMEGHGVIVVDNFSTGFRDSVLGGEIVDADILDANALTEIFTRRRVDAVMHFASFIQVGESVAKPGEYYVNNLAGTLALLQAMVRADIKQFIFSSTAAVYGSPTYVPIDEAHPKNPINPYGRSKWMVEQLLEDFERAYQLRSVCLRYFNAAGADPGGFLGERHDPETHLIPLVLQAASGRRDSVTVFGRDYDTPDGTCIRDYIHVADLVEAHALALAYSEGGGESAAFNLGNGQGFSVNDVITEAKSVTGRDFKVFEAARRDGDPPVLVADATKAKRVLGWHPIRGDLGTIIKDAWNWERKWPWGKGA